MAVRYNQTSYQLFVAILFPFMLVDTMSIIILSLISCFGFRFCFTALAFISHTTEPRPGGCHGPPRLWFVLSFRKELVSHVPYFGSAQGCGPLLTPATRDQRYCCLYV